MKGKDVKTMTCNWLKMTPVQGEQNEANTEEEFLRSENLYEIFSHRVNLLLQQSGMKIGMTLK